MTTSTSKRNPSSARSEKPAELTLVKGPKPLLLADGKTKANVEAMRKAAKHLGVTAPKQRGAKPDGELLAAIRLEVNKRLEAISQDDHVQCLECQEIATDDVPFCPYCGDEGNVVSEDVAKATAALAGESLVDEEADEPADEPADEEESDEEESDEEESAEEESDEDDEEESDEEEDDDPEASVGIAPQSKAPVVNVDAAMAKLASDLDARIKRIADMRKNAVALTYDIGSELREIRDQQLFKARGYSSFRAFAEKELPFTRESALELIRIVEKNTREDFEQLGYSKMRLIASEADVEVKAELIEAAKKGATTRELRELTDKASSTAKGNAATAAKTKTKAAATPPDKGERITLLGKVNARKQVVQLHNSETGEVIVNAGVFTKKSFVPSAYGELEISSGVFLRIGLRVSANQELTGFTVRFVRSADET